MIGSTDGSRVTVCRTVKTLCKSSVDVEQFGAYDKHTNPQPLSQPSQGTAYPGTMVPGTMVPGTMVPGTMVPGTMVPGTMVPGTVAGAAATDIFSMMDRASVLHFPEV